MAPTLSPNPGGTTFSDTIIKQEAGDEAGDTSKIDSHEEPSVPLVSRITSHDQDVVISRSIRSNSPDAASQNPMNDETVAGHLDIAKPMQTRQALSRKQTTVPLSTDATNPDSLPQVINDVKGSRQKKGAIANNGKSSSGEDSEDKDKENRTLKKEVAKLRKQIFNDSTKLPNLDRKIKQLEKALSLEKGKVKAKRDEYQRRMKSGPVAMGDDGLMRTQLSHLGDMCKDWASTHANTDEAGKKYNDAEKSSILNLLKVQYDAVSEHGEAKIFDGMTNCAELLLNAALTHLIWFEILNRPFYFVEHAGMAGGPAGVEEALKWLVQLGDSSGVVAQKLNYCWLGTLLKTLNPTSTADGEGQLEKVARSKNKTLKDASFGKLEILLKRHCGSLLVKTTDKETRKRDVRLWHIFRAAHELSCKLWTQGYKIGCYRREHLEEVFLNGEHTVRAHLTMLIDDQTTSRDGQHIYLVTKPLLKAFGNDKGEFETAMRNFDPATVVTATIEDLERATRAREEEQKQQNYGFVHSATGIHEVKKLAQQSAGKAIERAADIPGFRKRLAASLLSGDASPASERRDVPSKAQAPSNFVSHGPKSAKPGNNHNAADQQTPDFGRNLKRILFPRDDEFSYEQVNVKTGDRKRVRVSVEIFDEDDLGIGSSADSSAGGAENDESFFKKGRKRKRNRGGKNEVAHETEIPEKSTTPVGISPNKAGPFVAAISNPIQGNTAKE